VKKVGPVVRHQYGPNAHKSCRTAPDEPTIGGGSSVGPSTNTWSSSQYLQENGTNVRPCPRSTRERQSFLRVYGSWGDYGCVSSGVPYIRPASLMVAATLRGRGAPGRSQRGVRADSRIWIRGHATCHKRGCRRSKHL